MKQDKNNISTISDKYILILKQILEDTIIPNFGYNLKFTIELGLFTSDEYGSYRLNFYDKNDNEICYIIADTIAGEWKTYKKQTT